MTSGVLLILLPALVASATSADGAICPKDCSGKGTCDINGVCTCFTGYRAPDCGTRRCATGAPWAAKAPSGGDAHAVSIECGGNGLCVAGTCSCNPGWYGTACNRRMCRNECNGHGVCTTIAGLSRYAGRDQPSHDTASPYDGYGLTYSGWEATMLSGCLCDGGYTGPDCSQSVCPHGDSPDTTNQQRFTMRVAVNFADVAVAANRGIRLVVSGQTSSVIPFATTPTSAQCLAALAPITGIDTASTTCYVRHNSGGGAAASVIDGEALTVNTAEIVLAVAFKQGGVTANNLFGAHGGTVPLSELTCYFAPTVTTRLTSVCDISLVDVTTMTLISAAPAIGTSYAIEVLAASEIDVPNKVFVTKTVAGAPSVTTTVAAAAAMSVSLAGVDLGDGMTVRWAALAGHTQAALWIIDSTGVASSPTYREWSPCSLSGVCSPDTGACTCGLGHTGSACQTLSGAAAVSGLAASPLLTLRAVPADYVSNVLEISSVRPLSSSFNYISVWDASNAPWFKLTGTGLLSGLSLAMAQGATIDAGTIATMSASVVTASKPSLDVTWTASTTAATSGVMRVRSDIALNSVAPLPSSYSLFRVQAKTTSAGAAYTDVLTVRGDGATTVAGTCTCNKIGIDIVATPGAASAGVATLFAGTATIATTAITASSIVMLTYQAVAGTPGVLYVSARVAGVSVTITSSSGTDVSGVAWLLIN